MSDLLESNDCSSYIADMTPLCALAIIASGSRPHAPILRDWLQRYISHRVFFGVFMVGFLHRMLDSN